MAIYTKFDAACRYPVKVLKGDISKAQIDIEESDGALKQTYINELKADGGFNEICDAINEANDNEQSGDQMSDLKPDGYSICPECAKRLLVAIPLRQEVGEKLRECPECGKTKRLYYILREYFVRKSVQIALNKQSGV